MIWRCDLVKQYIKYENEIIAAFQKVLKSGKYVLGEEVNLFEKEFARYLNVNHAIGVASGTDGLLLAMMALNIKPGDEIITTPFTAIPTVSAIIHLGAKPVFVDVDYDTYLIDIDKLKDAITKNTKAIIPVHLFGNVVDVKKIKEIVGNEIPVIEDACQAHGSKMNGQMAGTLGDIGVFSFYPTKNLGAYGDGGMIVTNNENIAYKIRLMRMYGMVNYNNIEINGINSRLDEIQAAILRVKLRYLDEMNKARNIIANRYKEKLNAEMFKHQYIPRNVYTNYHVFESRYLGDRDALVNFLNKEKVQTNIYYFTPIHLQKANKFLGYKKGDFPITEKLCKEVIALPMYAELSSEDQTFIINKINKYIEGVL